MNDVTFGSYNVWVVQPQAARKYTERQMEGEMDETLIRKPLQYSSEQARPHAPRASGDASARFLITRSPLLVPDLCIRLAQNATFLLFLTSSKRRIAVRYLEHSASTLPTLRTGAVACFTEESVAADESFPLPF